MEIASASEADSKVKLISIEENTIMNGIDAISGELDLIKSDGGTDRVNAEFAARVLMVWGQRNRLIGDESPVALGGDENTIAEMFRKLRISNEGAQILRHREIKFVAFNNETKTVFIYTVKKITANELKKLPAMLAFEGDISLQFQHCGTIQASAPSNTCNTPYYLHNGRYCCGSSINPARFVGAGTMGCLVVNQAGVFFGLTNNHVSGICNYAMRGEKIIAPGHIDVAAFQLDPFTIGYHESALPMVCGVPDNVSIAANSDAAIFHISNINNVCSMQGAFYDTPCVTADPQPAMIVEKIGRTTGHTRGVIQARSIGAVPTNYSVPGIGVGNQLAYHDEVYSIHGDADTAFSDSGDSGSLVTTVINGVRHAVGLIYAGNSIQQPAVSMMLPINKILSALNVTLVSNHNVN